MGSAVFRLKGSWGGEGFRGFRPSYFRQRQKRGDRERAIRDGVRRGEGEKSGEMELEFEAFLAKFRR